ncbi:MAG: cytosolic protein [Planctomycetes bacterium]|nr:cytosolic protein [Planctomycetota bacterium]
MECKKEANKKTCACTYMSCQRRGICCDCVVAHLKQRQIPGCFFSPDAEKSYDRSFEHFARLVTEGKI